MAESEVMVWEDGEAVPTAPKAKAAPQVNGVHASESFENSRPIRVADLPQARVSPHSLEAEEAAISCIFVDPDDVLPRFTEAKVTGHSFYDPDNAEIVRVILGLYSAKKPVDIAVVAEELKSSRTFAGKNIFAKLMQVSERTSTTAQASYFIEKVREQALLRQLIRTATGAVEDCYSFSGGIEDFLTSVRTKIESATDGSTNSIESRKFNPDAPLIEERSILSLGKTTLATAGNLMNIVALSGVGKTAVGSAIIAASFITGTDTNDCLGFSGPNYAKLPFLHFDTEQSAKHYQQNLLRALARSGRPKFPAWFHSYHLTGASATEARHSVESTIAHHARRAGGIFAILIDGWADLVISPNDERECFPFVTRMHDLAIRHDTAIIGVLHLNPAKPGDTTKGRGHLGSHLDRKAETVLQLEMNPEGVTSMFTSKARGAPVVKSSAPSFRWSDEHQRHMICATPASEGKTRGGRPEKYAFNDYRTLFPSKSERGLELGPLHKRLMTNGEIKKPLLHNTLKRWADDGHVEIIAEHGYPMRYRATV